MRVLLLHGGWPGHTPDAVADFAEKELLDGAFDGPVRVDRSDDLGSLTPAVLAAYDVLLPVWTFGELTPDAETALLEAVADGLGLVAWHGAASAFLASRPYKHLLGGQFVAHPGGDDVRFTVRFDGDDPLVAGLPDVTVTSEQYYLLVDPAVKVLAHTRFDGSAMPWLDGVQMPATWTRDWGRGRVFYCSLGHTVDELREPAVTTLLRRALAWAYAPRRGR